MTTAQHNLQHHSVAGTNTRAANLAAIAPDVRVAVNNSTQNLIEAFGVLCAWSLVGYLSYRCMWQVSTSYRYEGSSEGNLRVLLMVSAAVAGYVVADLVSGVVHWGFDRFGSSKTFFLGAHFVTPFRLHHSDPIDITRHGFLATNGSNCLATVIPLWLIMIAPFSYDNRFWHWCVFMLTIGAVATFATNQFHKWAHTPRVSPAIDWLQRHRVILPRDHHQIHHRWPYETHYCITTGWLNAPLVKIGFWWRLERALQWVGLAAHRDDTPVLAEDDLPPLPAGYVKPAYVARHRPT